MDRMAPILAIIGNASSVTGELLIAASEDLTLFGNQDWQLRMAAALVLLDLQADELLAISVPETLRPMDRDIKAAARLLKKTVELMPQAIDTLDAEAFQKVTEMSTKAAALLVSSDEKLQRICGER